MIIGVKDANTTTMRTIVGLCLIQAFSAQTGESFGAEPLHNQIRCGHRNAPARFIGSDFGNVPENCMSLILGRNDCSHQYFSFKVLPISALATSSSSSDSESCVCIPLGTDCTAPSNLKSMALFQTFTIIDVESAGTNLPAGGSTPAVASSAGGSTPAVASSAGGSTPAVASSALPAPFTTAGIDVTLPLAAYHAVQSGVLTATRTASGPSECHSDETYFLCQQAGSSTDNYDYCGDNSKCPVNSVHSFPCCYCGGCLKAAGGPEPAPPAPPPPPPEAGADSSDSSGPSDGAVIPDPPPVVPPVDPPAEPPEVPVDTSI